MRYPLLATNISYLLLMLIVNTRYFVRTAGCRERDTPADSKGHHLQNLSNFLQD